MSLLLSLRAFGILVLFALAAIPIFGQQARIVPLPVRPSTFFEDFKSFATSNPKATLAERVEAANGIVERSGLDFVFFLDPATCQKVEEARRKSKDPSGPIRLSGTLRSVDAEAAQLALPDVQPGTAQCGCYFAMPLLQITASDFITKVLGRNIRFYLPGNVTPNFAYLVDQNEHGSVKRKWAIPDRLMPIGVSFDENVLYLGFREPELNDMAIAVFGEGVFQIVSRVEAEDGGKGVPLRTSPTDEREFMSFNRWKKTFVVAFKAACPR